MSSPSVQASPLGFTGPAVQVPAWTGAQEVEWRRQHDYVPDWQPNSPPPAPVFPGIATTSVAESAVSGQIACPPSIPYEVPFRGVADSEASSDAYPALFPAAPPGILSGPVASQPKLNIYRPADEPPALERSAIGFQESQSQSYQIVASTQTDYVASTPTQGVRAPRNSASTSENLPVPAHVKFDVNPTSTYGYAPLGLPGAYSGMEREAGDYMTHDTPRYERDPSDPFARKYYDLRFFPTDFDSPRPCGGGGGTPAIMAVIVGFTPQQTGMTGTIVRQQIQINTFSSGMNVAPDPGGPFPCTIGQILSTESIPDGTIMMVTQDNSGNYWGQLPIWLE